MDKTEKVPSSNERPGMATDWMRRAVTSSVMTLELVSAIAGDRELTEEEASIVQAQRAERGEAFFSDLLFGISHHYFAPEIAEDLWRRVLLHKHLVSEQLGRNVRVTVAALDYLSNVTGELGRLTLISEANVLRMTSLSMRDGMTGLFNHSSCYELLDLELRSHKRYGVGVALLLADIDDFKSVNDRSGHLEGDRVLIDLAGVLVEQSRESDICCRVGGDEFVVILRLTSDADEALEVGERIRARASTLVSAGHQVTISVGVALCAPGESSARDLMARADRALYAAKTGGRNRVASGIPSGSPPSVLGLGGV